MKSDGILRDRVGYELKRAEHALRVEMDGTLRSVGLTTPQYAALAVLEGDAGLSGAALARRCFVTPQTMNGILGNLEGMGLLLRRPHPEHGRVLQAFLTEEGGGIVARAHELVGAIEERMLAGLGEDERTRLLHVLRGCADALADGA